MTFAHTVARGRARRSPRRWSSRSIVAGERRRRRLVGRLGELPLVRRMMAAASPGRRRVKAILLALAVGLTVAARSPVPASTAGSSRSGAGSTWSSPSTCRSR